MPPDAPPLTPFRQLLLHSRSHRDYREGIVPGGDLQYILDCASTFQERCRFSAPRIIAVPRGPVFERIATAAVGRFPTVNAWLPRTHASHLLLCAAVPDLLEDPVRPVEQAAMCMQVAVLAATELGYGTCWMTGINHERVEEVHPLPDGARLIALSPLGFPKEGGALTWDSLMHRFVSKDRRPLEEITMREVWR